MLAVGLLMRMTGKLLEVLRRKVTYSRKDHFGFVCAPYDKEVLGRTLERSVEEINPAKEPCALDLGRFRRKNSERLHIGH